MHGAPRGLKLACTCGFDITLMDITIDKTTAMMHLILVHIIYLTIHDTRIKFSVHDVQLLHGHILSLFMTITIAIATPMIMNSAGIPTPNPIARAWSTSGDASACTRRWM